MPQRIDVPGMGIVEFPDGMDDNAITAAIQKNMQPAVPEKPFFEKLSNFASKVWNDPPPSIAGLGRAIKEAPAAARELTWGNDPQAAEQAAGAMLTAGGLGVGMAPTRLPGGVTAPRPAVPPVRPPVAPSAVDPALEAAGRLGVDIPRYMATESTAIPQLAAGIKNVPMAGQPIVQSAERLTEQLGTVKKGLGAGTAETAGERAKSGLTGFIKTESQKPVSEAYRAVDELVDPAVRVPLDNTRAMVGEIMAERTAARIPGRSKAVETVFDAVQDPAGMDYQGTKGLRSFLGEKSPQELAVSGLAPTEVKRLYSALTRDLGAVVRESSPEAFGKWQEANALARLTNMQRSALSKVTGAAGDAAPEAIFNRLVGYAQSKGGADLNRLRLAKRAMGPDAWNEVGSALINRLGQAPDGQFSAQRFVTAFGNMAPAARNELFSGQQHAALQDLFTVSQYVKDRIGRFENVSGTSRGMFGGGMLTGALADPISIIGGMVGTRLLAEALARPAIIRAATAVTRAQIRRNPVATRRALQQLYNIALRTGLISAAQQREQPIEPRQAGGPVEERHSYLVGERGPELFVPDQADDDPWARVAARTGHRGRREGAGTAFVEGGYGIPAAYRALDRGAQAAFEEGGKIQHYGNEYYDAGPVTQQALGATVVPLVGPAQAGAALGAGVIRRAKPAIQAPSIRNPDAPLFDYSKLREVPDVPQTNLQRYEAPRGVPERTQALASPENVTRVNEVVKRGAGQGGIEWYNTDPLRQAFIEARGPEGEAAYRQYLDLVASTSPRSKVSENARNAAYYYGLAQRGEPLPEVIAKGGALSVKEALPTPYGHIAQGLHAQNARNVLEGGGWPVLQNPKPASFVENLAGNQMPVTVDTHNARLWGMTDTKGRPVDKPAKTEYGFMEKLQQDEARKLGMTPAQYQASAWIGGGEQTGLKSSADPFLRVLENRIRLTAEKTGETPQDVLRRFLMGQNAPGRHGPLLSVAPVPAPSRQD